MNHRPRLEKELSELEFEYKMLARKNPVSINETKRMQKRLGDIIERMKTIRSTKTISRPVHGTHWLREILYSQQECSRTFSTQIQLL